MGQAPVLWLLWSAVGGASPATPGRCRGSRYPGPGRRCGGVPYLGRILCWFLRFLQLLFENIDEYWRWRIPCSWSWHFLFMANHNFDGKALGKIQCKAWRWNRYVGWFVFLFAHRLPHFLHVLTAGKLQNCTRPIPQFRQLQNRTLFQCPSISPSIPSLQSTFRRKTLVSILSSMVISWHGLSWICIDTSCKNDISRCYIIEIPLRFPWMAQANASTSQASSTTRIPRFEFAQPLGAKHLE